MTTEPDRHTKRGELVGWLFSMVIGIAITIYGLRGGSIFFWRYANPDQSTDSWQLIAGGVIMAVCSLGGIWSSLAKQRFQTGTKE